MGGNLILSPSLPNGNLSKNLSPSANFELKQTFYTQSLRFLQKEMFPVKQETKQLVSDLFL